MIDIYSKENCGYCDAAKKLLDGRNIVYNEIQIGRDISREDFMERFPHARTVPVILIEGKHIGGYTDLVEYYKSK